MLRSRPGFANDCLITFSRDEEACSELGSHCLDSVNQVVSVRADEWQGETGQWDRGNSEVR